MHTKKNALIAMINDSNMTIRELGFRRILNTRQESEETPRNSCIIRQFDVPEIILRLSTILDFFTGNVIIKERSLQSQRPFPKKNYVIASEMKKSWMKNCLIFHATLKQANGASNWSLKHLAKCMGKTTEMVLFEQQLNCAGKCHDLSQRKT